MQDNATSELPTPKRIPWNKGKLTGAKPPLRQKHVWAIRTKLQAEKPLTTYRIEELERMRLAFHGFDSSYHVARWRFITREPIARTPLHLARHRRKPIDLSGAA